MNETQPILRYIANETGSAPFSSLEQVVLDRINQKVAAAPSLHEMMGFVFDSMLELYPCDRIGLAFLEDEGRRVVAQWARATYEPLLLKSRYAEDISGSSLRTVFETRSPRIINDLARYGEEHPRSISTSVLLKEGVRSSLTCALSVEDRTCGFLFLSSRRPNAYTLHHVGLWQAVAERLSQAVEKAWRIEQLLAANQAYNEVLAFVSHELKNPVASMITDARVLAQGYLGALEDRQVQKLEQLIKKGDYLLDLIREYLDLARMEGGQLRLNAVKTRPVEDLIESAVELVLPQIQENGMTVERDFPARIDHVDCDPALLKIVLVNLVGNAAKYGHPNGLIRISLQQRPDRFRIAVWNEGPGFPPQERSRLFRKFSRLQTPELRSRKGTGVGLYTAWRIVNLHGGRMEADSNPGQWAEFSLEIPQPLPESPDAPPLNP